METKGLRKEREVKGSENENCEGEGAKTNWEGKEKKIYCEENQLGRMEEEKIKGKGKGERGKEMGKWVKKRKEKVNPSLPILL